MWKDKNIVMNEWMLPLHGSPKHNVEIITDELIQGKRGQQFHELTVKIEGVLYKTFYEDVKGELAQTWGTVGSIYFTKIEG